MKTRLSIHLGCRCEVQGCVKTRSNIHFGSGARPRAPIELKVVVVSVVVGWWSGGVRWWGVRWGVVVGRGWWGVGWWGVPWAWRPSQKSVDPLQLLREPEPNT